VTAAINLADPASNGSFSAAAFTACLLLTLLAPLAIAGMALIGTGLSRSRSAAQSMIGALCLPAAAAIAYVACGFAWEGFSGLALHSFNYAGKTWDWIGAGPFFLHGLNFDMTRVPLAALLQVFTVGIAALIPWGAAAERWRLSSACITAALLGGLIYPLFGHWSWGAGWLTSLGANFGLGRGFIDAGGAVSIHVVGGITALVVVWIAGPRRGKFQNDNIGAAIPGHNVIYVLFGCLLALVGWIGINGAAALLFLHVDITALPLIIINTMLAAGGALLAALVLTRSRFGKPDASLGANGWFAGLVAGSAVAALMQPLLALLVGIVAGLMVTILVEWFELKLKIDDPAGAIPVHAGAGLWGLFAAGLFGTIPSSAGIGSDSGQFLAQWIGIAALLGAILPLTYILVALLNRFMPLRVDREGERMGMDLHELGAGAYPEFVIHSDEFIQR
jgi:Amt family ammonium transporter